MKKKSKRDLADEAWMRAQQIDITGELASTGAREEGAPVEGVPETCPGCAKRMTSESGWTILSESGTPWQHGHLVCGACGHEVLVTIEARDRLRAEFHRVFEARAARLAPLPKGTSGPRVRGAG